MSIGNIGSIEQGETPSEEQMRGVSVWTFSFSDFWAILCKCLSYKRISAECDDFNNSRFFFFFLDKFGKMRTF